MKKKIFYLFAIVIASVLVVSCIDIFEPFDDSLLIGKWQSGTVYYSYNIDGSGKTWDEADDVKEDEAQSFSWTLVESELTHIHIMEMGGTVPKVYTVTELTATTLKYKDDFGKSFSFSKIVL